MTDILSAVANDMAEYECLCILYDEEIQTTQDAYGKWLPDCYSEHANKLKQQHLDNISNPAVKKTIASIADVTLTPVKFKVEQSYNQHVYFIARLYMQEDPKWYVLSGSEDIPETFSNYVDFKEGFDTPEATLNELMMYLKSSPWRS